MRWHRSSFLAVALVLTAMTFAGPVDAQGPGRGMRGMRGGMGMMGMGRDSATRAQMGLVHDLVMNHERITRTVTNLPDGIRTVTESDDSLIAKGIKEHVATMFVQTSTDSVTVAALQQHASEVSDLVRGGMAAMHEAMMKNGGHRR